MSLGKLHIGTRKQGGLLQLLVVAVTLFLSSPLVSAQTAKSALKMNPKAYTGKRAWWYNYQYFPELVIFGQNEDTVPDLLHRFSFYVSGGRAGLVFKESSGSASNLKGGMGLGFNYNYFFDKHWGFRTGLCYSYAATHATMGAFADKFKKEDQEADEILYDYKFSALEEDYKVHLLDVPLQLVYHREKVMAGLGFRFALPLKVAYNQSMANVNTKAYFPQYDVTVDHSWVMGCGDFASLQSQNKFSSTPMVILGTADVEYLFHLSKKYSVGVGAYIDYSLTSSFSFRRNQLDVVATSQNSIVGTSNDIPVFVATNSILAGMKDYEQERVIQHIKYFSTGLKVSVNINSYGPAKPKTLPY